MQRTNYTFTCGFYEPHQKRTPPIYSFSEILIWVTWDRSIAHDHALIWGLEKKQNNLAKAYKQGLQSTFWGNKLKKVRYLDFFKFCELYMFSFHLLFSVSLLTE